MKRISLTPVFLSVWVSVLLLSGILQTVKAQTNPALPRLVFNPKSVSDQVISLNKLITAQNVQIASLNATLAAKGAANPSAATVQGQPYANSYTDDSHLVFALCEMAPLYGNGPDAIVTAGFRREVDEAASKGIDGFALDTFDAGNYLTLDANMIAAIDQYNTAHTDASGNIPSNGHGVSRFYWVFCPDYINGAYEVDPIRTTFANFLIAHMNDASCARWHGRPVMTCYAGDGGGAATVAANYPPLLAAVRAANIPLLFWPGWGGSDGSTAVQELTAAGAEGDWAFPAKDTPLGVSSPLISTEALGISVNAAKTSAGVPFLWMQAIFPNGAYNGGLQSGSYWNDYGGSRGMAAQFASAKTGRPSWIMLLTWDDWGEGTGITQAASTAWQPGNWGYFGSGYIGLTQGFFQLTAGLGTDLSYCIQEYKTNQAPVVNSNTIVEYNRTETAAASLAAGMFYPINIIGDASGIPDVIDVTVYAKSSGILELSGVGPTQTQFVSAGVNRLRFSGVQAGLLFLQLKHNGQVLSQLTGHVISSTALVIPNGKTVAIPNLSTYSSVSTPGVSFTLSVPIPTGYTFDHAGLFCRSTDITYKSMGVSNVSVYDLTTVSAPAFAQNTLSAPASLGKTLDQVVLSGADTFSQYDSGYGTGQILLLASPFNASQPPAAYPNSANTNSMYDFSTKPLPSSHVRVHCRVTSTNTDPYANGQGGCAFVLRTGINTYFGKACFAYVEKYAGKYTLLIKAEDNVSSDTTSVGSVVLASIPINTIDPGEWYDIDLTEDGTTLTATATPSNQQL